MHVYIYIYTHYIYEHTMYTMTIIVITSYNDNAVLIHITNDIETSSLGDQGSPRSTHGFYH